MVPAGARVQDVDRGRRRGRAERSSRVRGGLGGPFAGDSDDPAVVVPRLWPDATVVCIATGPSLTAEDVNACRGQRVIVVNDAHRAAPWADVLYSSDQNWYEFHAGVPEFPGLKFGIQPLKPPADWRVTVLRNTGDRGLETHPAGLRTGTNSGASAINLAVHLGARRILLLGYDMGFVPGTRSHYFGEHPSQLRSARVPEQYRPFFELMVAPLRELGVQVINCSRQTWLDCFPRQDLREALAS